MIAWLKVIHIAALIVWCAGLLALPGLFARRARLDGEAMHELQRLTRRLFIQVTSPAAFVAIIAGTALIFAREVFTVWMMLKLLAVGLLVGLHIRTGYVVLGLFEAARSFARWRQVLSISATTIVIGAILLLVLAKPTIDLDELPRWMREPRGLQQSTSLPAHSLLDIMRPMP